MSAKDLLGILKKCLIIHPFNLLLQQFTRATQFVAIFNTE